MNDSAAPTALVCCDAEAEMEIRGEAEGMDWPAETALEAIAETSDWAAAGTLLCATVTVEVVGAFATTDETTLLMAEISAARGLTRAGAAMAEPARAAAATTYSEVRILN